MLCEGILYYTFYPPLHHRAGQGASGGRAQRVPASAHDVEIVVLVVELRPAAEAAGERPLRHSAAPTRALWQWLQPGCRAGAARGVPARRAGGGGAVLGRPDLAWSRSAALWCAGSLQGRSGKGSVETGR